MYGCVTPGTRPANRLGCAIHRMSCIKIINIVIVKYVLNLNHLEIPRHYYVNVATVKTKFLLMFFCGPLESMHCYKV